MKQFFDQRTQRVMCIMTEGPYTGWLMWKHPDGQWVTWRIATADDYHKLGVEESDGNNLQT